MKPTKYQRLIGITKRNRWSDTRVARRFGVSARAVSSLRAKLGLPRVPFPSLTPGKIKQILAMHADGVPAKKIKATLGVNTDTVLALIRERGQTSSSSVETPNSLTWHYPPLLIGLVNANRWSDARLARRLNVSVDIITRVRKKLGLPRVFFPSSTPLQINQILKLHLEGKTLNEIATQLNRSQNHIGRILNLYTRRKKE